MKAREKYIGTGIKSWLSRILAAVAVLGTLSCERFFDPDQDTILKEDQFFKDWYDYRSAEMGLYGLQQELAEQLLILGELRADLLTSNLDASRDLIEVESFNMTPSNQYASPRNFYLLIAGCNNLIRTLEHYHPEVTDKNANITNYDKLYGEVIVMRSWAYFNAVRIYGRIPWIPESLTSIDEIVEFVNSPQTIVDSMDILYNIDGYNNDTIWLEEPIELENAYLDLPAIVDSCTRQIETKIKDIGVDHSINNGDTSWEVTIWNEFGMYYLLGQMYMFRGDLEKAMYNFDFITRYVDIEANDVRYGLDDTFEFGRWKGMFRSVNINEHIFVMWFGKSHRQSNDFLSMFSNEPPNKYELKPTKSAVHYWETIWNGFIYENIGDRPPSEMTLKPGFRGRPGDFYRGYEVSYAYSRDGMIMSPEWVLDMLVLKADENDFEVNNIMENMDTVVYKYTLGRENDPYASDANFIVARAASVHLYAAEIYAYWAWDKNPRVPVPTVAEQYLNDGSYQGNGRQMGVRGRVGFSDGDEQVKIDKTIFYRHNPFTNRVIGYDEITALRDKQEWLEDRILEERARELAFEGERFYDLMRIAKKRGDNSYLADRVASKFQGAEKERIRSLLMDENNWYIPFLLTDEE